jgi:hypothetical protein
VRIDWDNPEKVKCSNLFHRRTDGNKTGGYPAGEGNNSVHSVGSNKEVAMHVMGRIGFMGLGVALAGCLSGAPVFAGDNPDKAPIEDGSKVMITSPKDGDKVSDSFELKYELTKGSQAAHVHAYVDDQYQKGFEGELKGLSKGTHKVTVKGATKDHDLVTATDTITVEVE